MLNISIGKAQSQFFDRKSVLSRVDKAKARLLSRFGAYVRQRARSSIRKRRKISAPGQPPSSHEGSLRKFLYFAYEPGRDSVVIGPALLRSADGRAPALLEYGGATTVRGSGTGRRLRYRPRPFMRPAFAAEIRGKLADQLKRMVSK